MTQVNVDKPVTGRDDLLGQFLTDRDVPCPRCGYNLRMLVGRQCPECGDELTLRVGLVEPRMGAYLTTLSASCAGVGGAGLFCVIGLSEAPSNWWTTGGAISLLVLLAISSVMLAMLLWKRRAFRAAPMALQRGFAIAACVVVVTLGALVVLLFDN